MYSSELYGLDTAYSVVLTEKYFRNNYENFLFNAFLIADRHFRRQNRANCNTVLPVCQHPNIFGKNPYKSTLYTHTVVYSRSSYS